MTYPIRDGERRLASLVCSPFYYLRELGILACSLPGLYEDLENSRPAGIICGRDLISPSRVELDNTDPKEDLQ